MSRFRFNDAIDDIVEEYRSKVGQALKVAEQKIKVRMQEIIDEYMIDDYYGGYVPKVYINFRKPDEKALDVITVAEAKQYLEEGHFAEGSMAPKIRAGIMFVENGGKECVITEAGQLGNPSCGTRIVK